MNKRKEPMIFNMPESVFLKEVKRGTNIEPPHYPPTTNKDALSCCVEGSGLLLKENGPVLRKFYRSISLK